MDDQSAGLAGRAPRREGVTAALAIDLLLKAALAGLLLFTLLRPDLPQFADKAILGRAIAYPLAAALVPIIWWMRRFRSPSSDRRRSPYPALIDALLTAPFLIDVAGNAADLYDTITWWDDANHAVNWTLLVGAITLAYRNLPISRGVLFGLGVGAGAITAIGWEAAEYVTFIRNSPELATAYTDTLGDLVLGLSGSVVAAAIVSVRSDSRSGRRDDGSDRMQKTQ